MSNEAYKYKRQAIAAAKDLCHPGTVIICLKAAKTEREIVSIMENARKEYL